MATTYVGNDGNVAGPLGIKMSTWNASFSSINHDVTGFSNAGRERKLGLIDITGSVGGFAQSDTAAPWMHSLSTTVTGATITLYVFDATNTNDGSIQFNAVISEVSHAVDKAGNNAVTMNFSLSSTATARTSLYTSVWQSS